MDKTARIRSLYFNGSMEKLAAEKGWWDSAKDWAAENPRWAGGLGMGLLSAILGWLAGGGKGALIGGALGGTAGAAFGDQLVPWMLGRSAGTPPKRTPGTETAAGKGAGGAPVQGSGASLPPAAGQPQQPNPDAPANNRKFDLSDSKFFKNIVTPQYSEPTAEKAIVVRPRSTGSENPAQRGNSGSNI